jgi:hypothetical protein
LACLIYTRMVGSVVRSFWFGESLSPIEHLCVKSFLAQGHRFFLYTYDEVENVPDGCELLDAASVLGEDQVFLYEDPHHAGSPAGFSNLFRYTLLDREGGWWVDTDTLCLTSRIPEPEYVFAKETFYYGNAVMRAPAASPLIREMLRRAKGIVAEQAGSMEYGRIGPQLLTEVVRDLDFADKATDTAAFYPIPYRHALVTCDPFRRAEVERRVAQSTFLHLWTAMFRYWGVPTTARPPTGSYLATMYDRYDVSSPNWTAYDWRAVIPKPGITRLPRAGNFTPIGTRELPDS